jgi:anti-sigma factor (TIGR02949 family)
MGQPATQCRAVEGFLQAYVDGELEGGEAAEMESHLAECESCARSARAQASFKDALRRAGDSQRASARLREAVRARLADPDAFDALDDDETERPTKGRWLTSSRGIAAAAAVAGAMVWFAAGGLHRPLFGPRQLSHQLIEDGVALHARTLPLDYVASDASAVQHWLQGKLDFGVQLPAFQNAAALQGVRLSQLRARSAVSVAYQLPQASRRVTLLIVDDPEPEMAGTVRRVADREVWLSHARGYNVASWRRDEIVYSLISDLDEQDVLALARAAQDR